MRHIPTQLQSVNGNGVKVFHPPCVLYACRYLDYNLLTDYEQVLHTDRQNKRRYLKFRVPRRAHGHKRLLRDAIMHMNIAGTLFGHGGFPRRRARCGRVIMADEYFGFGRQGQQFADGLVEFVRVATGKGCARSAQRRA